MIVNILEKIRFLKQSADPELSTYNRLDRLEGKVLDNVMLVPSDIRFLQELQQKHDNIECEHLSKSGECLIKRLAPCRYTKSTKPFRACVFYDPRKPKLKGNPLEKL